MKKKTRIEFEKSSGNVFADLGLPKADELFARAQLGFHIHNLLEARKLKQRDWENLKSSSRRCRI
jgi:predicted XRE-type DNA-binding protein